MNTQEILNKRKIEEEVRSLFNGQNQIRAKKKIEVGQHRVRHEFDLYDANEVIGGITTSPWKNKTGSYNTAGQDRASTELLWLSLWEGNEHRVMILTDKEMADKLFKRWHGCPFLHRIEIIYCNLVDKRFEKVGILDGGRKLQTVRQKP
jgi:hypothetical protein